MSRLADIQEQTLAIVFSRIAMYMRNSEEVKEVCHLHEDDDEHHIEK
jgi:hypothetical protein